MDILMTPIPLFSGDLAVEAYYLRYQKGNDLMLEGNAAGRLDGAMNSPPLEALKLVGIEPFAMDKPIFVPVSAMMLLGDLSRQCPKPYDKIIFLLGEDVKSKEQYVSKMRELKQKGFRFAMFKIERPAGYEPILAECDYIFVNQKSPPASISFSKLPPSLRHLNPVATHIDSLDEFRRLSNRRFSMFEGHFYRLPITKGRNGIAPLKINLVRLLNIVRDEGFDFAEITGVIERDTALSISLMQLVNSPYLNLSEKIKTIGHAIAMLGENEVRKWAATSVSRLLGSDKPDEITRLSLMRAKFGENLAELMNMASYKQSLFLTGLFSVLDIVLDLPMPDALAEVHVDDDVYNALVNHSGPFYPIFELIFAYEQSDWKYVSRVLILRDLSVEDIYGAYIEAVLWYKALLEEGPGEIYREAEFPTS